jgi:nucleoid-associated protein YgaU
MPEPVIIVGRGGAPAGPDSEAVGSGVGAVDAPQSGASEPSRAQSAATHSSRNAASWFLKTGARVLRLAIVAIFNLARSYPRHTLAAVVSAFILGGIWIAEHQAGKSSRPPVTGQIGVAPTAKAEPPKGHADSSVPPAVKPSDKPVSAQAGGTKSAPSVTASLPEAPTPSPETVPVPGDEPVLPALVDSSSTAGPEPVAPHKKSIATAEAPRPTSELTSEKAEVTPSAITLVDSAPTPSADETDKTDKRSDKKSSAPEPLAPAPEPAVTQLRSPLDELPPPKETKPSELASTIESPGDGTKKVPTPGPASLSTVDSKREKASGDAPSDLPGKARDDQSTRLPAAAPESVSKTDDHPAPPPGSDLNNAESSSQQKLGPDATKSHQAKPDEPLMGLPSAPSALPVPIPVPASPNSQPSISTPPNVPATAPRNEPGTGADHPSAAAVDSPNLGAHELVPRSDSPTPAPTAATPSPPLDARPGIPPVQDAVPGTAGPDAQVSQAVPASRREPLASGPASHDPPSEGWVVISNSGKLPTDGTEHIGLASSDSDRERDEVPSSRVTDENQSHAAKGKTHDLPALAPRTRVRGSKDPGSPQSEIAIGAAAQAPTKLDAVSAKVESVPHVVERGESFWRISELYYSSSRYYRALWKANADKYPDIRVLHIGDVIIVPPVEDLDPAYVGPARRDSGPAPVERRAGRGEADESDDPARSIESPLPSSVVRSVSRRERGGGRDTKAMTSDDRDAAEPETPTARRPAARDSKSSPASRLVYKVRPYDTLRSIARDTLGDARRSNEILDLNRELIDDPTHLTVGQVLNLPDDARTGRFQSASRPQ